MAWLKTHLIRFRLSQEEGLDLFSAAKPLGELCLVLTGIKNGGPSDLAWAKEIIHYLWMDLAHTDRTPYWRRLWEKIQSQDVYGEILQLFLHLEMLSGNRFSFHHQMQNYLLLVASRPTVALSLRYTCELAGEGSCETYAIQEVQEILSKQEQGNTLFSSDLYDLTHAIFYGCGMGIREVKWQQFFPHLPEVLRYHMHDRLERNDLDLAAELLFSLLLLKTPLSSPEQRTYRRLKENVRQNPVEPLKTGNLFYQGDRFASQYHLALVTLLTLHTFNTQKHVS